MVKDFPSFKLTIDPFKIKIAGIKSKLDRVLSADNQLSFMNRSIDLNALNKAYEQLFLHFSKFVKAFL
jgi:hypothetical protein